MRTLKQKLEEKPHQPNLCKGCIWGTWTGAKQYCPRLQCVKVE